MVIHKYVVLYLPSEFQKTPSRDKKFGESDDVNVTVYCDNATGWRADDPAENIYAWIKMPAINSADILNNPYLTFGVTYNGVDYEDSDVGIDTFACLDKYEQYYGGIYHDPVCNGSTLQKMSRLMPVFAHM